MAKQIKSVSGDPQGEHYAAICQLSHECAAAQQDWLLAKEDTSEKKKLYDRLADDLLTMIEGGPDWQRKLSFEE